MFDIFKKIRLQKKVSKMCWHGWAGWLAGLAGLGGAGVTKGRRQRATTTTTSSAVRNNENGRGAHRNLRALPTLEIISDVADPPFFDLGASGPSRTI